jgi:Na+-driven multidrug efflux pump
MKKIILFFLVCFIFLPVLHAILIPIIDETISPRAAKIHHGEYNTFRFIFIMTAYYYSIFFLVFAWLPYFLLQVFNKSTLFKSLSARFLELFILQVMIIYALRINEDYFRAGNSTLKWSLLLIISCLLLSLIPLTPFISRKQKNNI